jgi:hypothetical protein
MLGLTAAQDDWLPEKTDDKDRRRKQTMKLNYKKYHCSRLKNAAECESLQLRYSSS